MWPISCDNQKRHTSFHPENSTCLSPLHGLQAEVSGSKVPLPTSAAPAVVLTPSSSGPCLLGPPPALWKPWEPSAPQR